MGQPFDIIVHLLQLIVGLLLVYAVGKLFVSMWSRS